MFGKKQEMPQSVIFRPFYALRLVTTSCDARMRNTRKQFSQALKYFAQIKPLAVRPLLLFLAQRYIGKQ